MAVRNPVMKDGLYTGTMSDSLIQAILNVREAEEVSGLAHMIFDFDENLILRSLEEKKSIRSIVKEEGIDYRQYMGTLSPPQTVGTAFMYLSPRSMLGYGVGAGKTAITAGLINLLKKKDETKRFLVATDTSADIQIRLELIRFTGLNVIELPSEKGPMAKVIKTTDWNSVDGVVIRHSGLRSDQLLRWLSIHLNDYGMSKIFDLFVLDESSLVKANQIKTYQYVSNICNIHKRVHFLNATAFETNLMDIYNQIDIMNPDLLPKKWRIENEYCTFIKEAFWTKENGKAIRRTRRVLKGYKNQEKLKSALKLVYLGKPSKVKPNTYKVREVEPTPDQLIAIKQGYRYMEVLNCPTLLPQIGIDFTPEEVPKLRALIHLLEDDFQDSKIMIYCFYREAQRQIAEHLTRIGKNVQILNGEDDRDSKWAKMKEFNEGDCNVLVTNVKKAINLYNGDVCIFYTVETNPSKMEQIRGRIDRNVNDKIKTYVLLVYTGTPEYDFLTEVVKQRSEDAKKFTVDAKTAVDYFLESMENNDQSHLE